MRIDREAVCHWGVASARAGGGTIGGRRGVGHVGHGDVLVVVLYDVGCLRMGGPQQ